MSCAVTGHAAALAMSSCHRGTGRVRPWCLRCERALDQLQAASEHQSLLACHSASCNNELHSAAPSHCRSPTIGRPRTGQASPAAESAAALHAAVLDTKSCCKGLVTAPANCEGRGSSPLHTVTRRASTHAASSSECVFTACGAQLTIGETDLLSAYHGTDGLQRTRASCVAERTRHVHDVSSSLASACTAKERLARCGEPLVAFNIRSDAERCLLAQCTELVSPDEAQHRAHVGMSTRKQEQVRSQRQEALSAITGG